MAGQAIVTIQNKQWNVGIAATPWELTQGLGGLPDMLAQSGMLFDMGLLQTIQVTTVPMLFPLDVAFLSETLAITEIYRSIQPGYLVTSTSPARYFLEVNSGELEGIDNGDIASVEVLESPLVISDSGDWMPTFMSFMSVMIMGMFMISVMRSLTKGISEVPEERPRLLPQVKHGEKEIVLSSLVLEELTAAGLGNLAKEISTVVERRSRDNSWLELWDGTTFDRAGGYLEHIGLTIPRLVVAETGIRTVLSYKECVAIGERLDGKLKAADSIVLDDGTIFQKSYVPVRNESLPQTAKSETQSKYAMEYRVEQNKPYSTWAIVELFPGGTVRSPFTTREEAIKREEEIGEYYGWKLMRVELTPAETALLDNQRFPQRTAALAKLKGYDVIYVHDDGDLTVRSRGKLYVVTTEGQAFKQQYLPHTRGGEYTEPAASAGLVAGAKTQSKIDRLEYLADSPEFLTLTIADIGYRDKIDNAFQEAIARAKGHGNGGSA